MKKKPRPPGRPTLKPSQKKGELLRVRISSNLLNALERAAEERGESVSMITREAITIYLNQDLLNVREVTARYRKRADPKS